MLALTLTGYLLYYVGAEAVRSVMSVVHWAIGLGLPLLTGWHVWRGRASRRLRVAGNRAKNVAPPVQENEVPDGSLVREAGNRNS
jgi:hypothetical protein